MSASQSTFPVVPSKFVLSQRGQSGAWVSELLPHTAAIADRLTFIKTVNTEEINHDPAVTMAQTGFRLGGRPSMGSWISYGLGAETQDLPAFCVMISNSGGGQPLYDRLWGSGFLPSRYQGVKFRSSGDPVLYLSNPPGFTGANPAPISMPWANSTAPPPRNSATPKSLRAPPNTRWRSGCKPPFRN